MKNNKYHHIDHTHCWSEENPPCGQKVKHFKCCLCELTHPEITELVNQTLENQALALEGMKEKLKEQMQEFTNDPFHPALANLVGGRMALQQAADHLRSQKTDKKTSDDTIKALQDNK